MPTFKKEIGTVRRPPSQWRSVIETLKAPGDRYELKLKPGLSDAAARSAISWAAGELGVTVRTSMEWHGVNRIMIVELVGKKTKDETQ